MTVAVRVDSSGEIGTGHLVRCLTLAEALRAHGEDVVFVMRWLPKASLNLPSTRGFTVLELPAAGRAISQEEDAEQTVAALHAARVSATALVVDLYALDARWERAVRLSGPVIIAIDDLADRHHDCDLLLDQNLYDGMEIRYAGLVPDRCRLLLGPKWALLGREFAASTPAVVRDGMVRRLLVSYGGTDPTRETEKALEAVATVNGLERVDVVVGPAFQSEAVIRGFVEGDSRLRVHFHPRSLSGLMVESELSLGAGGSTGLERCILGLPAIVTSVASNQVESARMLASRGAALYIGPAEDVRAEDLRAALRCLMADPARVRMMSRAAAAIIGDEYVGAAGVAGAIMEVAHGES